MIIHFSNNPGNLHPDQVYDIHELRARSDCVWMDAEGVKRFNPSLHLIETKENFKRHPLRLIWISLEEINFEWTVFSDQWKRNTMVLASDSDVLNNQAIVRELEKRGIALLMTGNEANPIVSVMRSLTSMRFETLLIEGSEKSVKIFQQYINQLVLKEH